MLRFMDDSLNLLCLPVKYIIKIGLCQASFFASRKNIAPDPFNEPRAIHIILLFTMIDYEIVGKFLDVITRHKIEHRDRSIAVDILAKFSPLIFSR